MKNNFSCTINFNNLSNAEHTFGLPMPQEQGIEAGKDYKWRVLMEV